MNYAYKNTILSKALLGAVFTGIFVTFANLAFDYIYRYVTGYSFSEIINVPSLIFFSMLTLLLAGTIFFFAEKMRAGIFIYMGLFVVLTAISLFIHLGTTMPNGVPIAASAHGLTMGIFLITGLSAAFAVPYMAKHSTIWS